MTKGFVQFLGRKITAGLNLIDKAVAVDDTYIQAGKLQVHINPGNITGGRTIVGNVWATLVTGTTASPVMLRKVEVFNASGGALTLRLAIMTVAAGSPATSNAVLAWDTPIADGGSFTWAGEIPLVGRYFYAKGSALGMCIYTEYENLTPA